MILNSKKIASAILIGITLFSCTDDYFEFDKVVLNELNPEFAIPLVNSSLTLDDILSNSDSSGFINTDPNNGVLEILYEGNVFSATGGANIALPNVSENTTINSIPNPPVGLQFTYPISDTIDFQVQDGIEVDSLLLKEGKLVLDFQSTVRHPIDIVVNFPSFKNASGVTLSRMYTIAPSDGSVSTGAAEIIELKDYLIDFSLEGTSFNKIPFEFIATITGQAGAPPGSTGNLELTTSFRNSKFREFYGFTGREPIDLKADTVIVALLKNFENGKFYLSDPSLDITVKNSYGMPLSLGFDYLDAILSTNPFVKKAIDLGINNPKSLNYPTKYGVAETPILLNKNNSNIPEIISDLVKKIAFDAKASPNLDTTTKVKNFMSDTSSIGLSVKLKLPLVGLASGFTIKDTIDFDFESAGILKNGLIKVRIDNGFPMQGELQLVFADNNYNSIDSLFTIGQKVIIPAAPINANGISTQTVKLTTDAVITEKRLESLEKTKFLILKAELETTNGSSAIPDTVKFLPSYKLDVAIGIKASILID